MGLFLPEKKALYIHLPRTGGFWTQRALTVSGITHHYDTVYRRHGSPRLRQETFLSPRHHPLPLMYNPLCRAKFMWASVRHPVGYWESMWQLLKHLKDDWIVVRSNAINNRHRWHPMKGPLMVAAGLPRMDFDMWVERMLDRWGGWVSRYFECAIGPEWGEWCQFVGRVETLQDDFCAVMEILGYNIDRASIDAIPHIGSRKKWPIIWRPDLLDQVKHEERIALARWYGPETRDRRIYSWLLEGHDPPI